MEKIHLLCMIISVFCVAHNQGALLSWNIFQTGNSTSSPSNIKAFAHQRLAALRNLRNQLYNSTRKVQQFDNGDKMRNSLEAALKNTKLVEASASHDTSAEIKPLKREVGSGALFRNLDKLFSLARPLKKMITSKQGIESLASMVMPKRDVLQKLLEIKGHLEPSLKRYLTDTYNGFLSSLIPYSENIGVPPFVLNSMKIPQGLDPRWQIIASIIKSKDGVENFIHSIVSGDAFEKFPQVVESRSGDETDLISDQEPDATGQAYRKHQQMYLSSFKKRLMKPGAGRYRLMPTSGGLLRPSLDYENILDQNGQFSQISYDLRAPDDIEILQPGGGEMDMLMSASGYGGRGHGGGGHGHGSPTYGGFLDPFTILGGLAFLTYLGLLLQNSLNRDQNMNPMPNPMGQGRSLPWENLHTANPLNILTGKPKRVQRRRHGRSIHFNQSKDSQPQPMNRQIDEIVNEITGVWEELREFSGTTATSNSDCARKKICKLVHKMKNMDLVPMFVNKLISSTKSIQHKFVMELLGDEDLKYCEPYWIVRCNSRH